MPIETPQAIEWALTQTVTLDGETYPVTKDYPPFLVDKVSEYFNENGIEYGTFSYDDLKPFLENA